MNKRQKIILAKFCAVIVVTIIAAFAMIVLKNRVNRSEAIRAMTMLAEELNRYRDNYGTLPPETYLDRIVAGLEGRVRLGKVEYRNIWIDLSSDPDPNEILAYCEKDFYSVFTSDGYIVLRLSGRVDWMKKNEFQKLLESQQSDVEKMSGL